MCGIAGIYSPKALSDDAPEHVENMLLRLLHRGPDESGICITSKLAMGVVRLGILDIDHGQQPICDEEKNLYLCYNGEVYNFIELRKELAGLGFAFRANSDTEVVLRAWQAWGVDCLLKFNGAFAFVLYDRSQERLYLARDRFGQRPLFFTQFRGDLYFSSELKGFMSVPGFDFNFNIDHLASILNLWAPLSHQSAFRDIEQVPIGSYLVANGNGIKEHCYNALDFRTQVYFKNEQDAQQQILDGIRKSVAIHSRMDVKHGIYLSGGLDSSILGVIATEHSSEPINTFSIAFEDACFDESSEQRLIAEHINSNHFTLHVNDSDIVSAFPEAVYHAEVPVFRTALVPMYLLSKAAKTHGVKVILSGEGADEAFMGYDIFKETRIRSLWADLDHEERSHSLRELYPYLDHYAKSDIAVLTSLYHQFSNERHPGLFSHEIRIQNGMFSKRLLKEKVDGLGAISNLVAKHKFFYHLNDIQKAQWIEFQTLLSGYLLSTQGDRMSLANSVENRCPFLDLDLIGFSCSVNNTFDFRDIEKRILRETFRASLPREILEKRKYPYRAPDSSAFVNEKPDYLELILSGNEIRKLGFVDEKFCEKLTRRVMNANQGDVGIKENQAFIFLLSICLLHYQYVDKNKYIFGKNNSLIKTNII